MMRDLGTVTDILAETRKRYLKTIHADQYLPIMPQCRFHPSGHGQMCGCPTHLISHGIYAKKRSKFGKNTLLFRLMKQRPSDLTTFVLKS